MVDTDRIEALFGHLDDYLAQLAALARYPETELIGDGVRLNAAKYELLVAIEICLDVAAHLIAREGWRKPRDYADSFVVLGETGVLEGTFVTALVDMVHFRNRLVHLYAEVDAGRIYRILQENVGDLRRFEAAVLDYVARQKPPGKR